MLDWKISNGSLTHILVINLYIYFESYQIVKNLLFCRLLLRFLPYLVSHPMMLA